MFRRLTASVLCLLAATLAGPRADVSANQDDQRNEDLVRERGVIQGADETTLVSPTSAVLVSIVPEGTRVNQGDLLAALDDSRLNGQLTRQQTVTKQALDSWTSAKNGHQHTLAERTIQLAIVAQAVRLAEIDKQRVLGEGGSHEQEVSAAESEKRVAELDVELKRQRVETLRESATAAELKQAQLKSLEAETRLAQACYTLDRLRGATLSYRQTQLEIAILRARVEELKIQREYEQKKQAAEKNVASRRNVMETMKTKLQQLEESIARCQVVAPHAGIVEYAEQIVARPGRVAVRQKFEQGTVVRAKQPIIRLVRIDRLRVETRIAAKRAGRVRLGQEALVRVDTLPQHKIRGVVSNVTTTIDPGAFVDEGLAEYVITVALEPPHPQLRLGLNAIVEIDTSTADEE